MKIYIINQEKNFQAHLQRLRQAPVIHYDISQLKETRSQITINTPKTFHEIDLTALHDYSIFPGNIMTSLPQWKNEKRAMLPGDTIVQQVFIPPFGPISQKIVFGVRINKIIDEPGRIGYSYETLEGHVEKGVSTFTVEKTADGKIIFCIHTYSAPATVLTKILGPVFSVPYQAYCTRQALMNMKKQLEQ